VSRRVQDSVADLPTGREAEAGSVGPRALAGMFATAGFAGPAGRRGASRTCTLWDRVFACPGQTDAGWPKKVSRRVQDSVADLPAGTEAEAGSVGPRALAGTFATAGFAEPAGRGGASRTCTLWDRVFACPGQTDAGSPKKVSRRVQDPAADLPTGRQADGMRWAEA